MSRVESRKLIKDFARQGSTSTRFERLEAWSKQWRVDPPVYPPVDQLDNCLKMARAVDSSTVDSIDFICRFDGDRLFDHLPVELLAWPLE